MNATRPLITSTDFVFVPTRNFEMAEKFYGGILGLPMSKRYKDGIGGEFETGSLTIQLVETEKIGREFEPTSAAIALRVDDVEAARAELESQNVEFMAKRSTAASATRRTSDPDGNALILHHRYAPPGVLPE